MATYMISCGEASGDLYAAALASALEQIDPGAHLFGLAGGRFEAAGGRLAGDYRGLAVTGLTEALSVLPRSWRVYRDLVRAAREHRPDVFVAIDFPDFNFRLAAAMKRLGIPIVYYICPQVWAWRSGRIRTLKRLVDRALVIFPFEGRIYTEAGIPVTFVGHPLLDLAEPTVPRDRFLPTIGLDPRHPTVALLPGSRPNELRQLTPVLAEAARIIVARVPDVRFVVARAPGLEQSLFAPFIGQGLPLTIVESQTDQVLASCDLVLTCSGTATVQAAIHERAMVILYRVSPLSYRLGHRFLRVNTYGMVNLLAGERIVPELIQDECTPARVADEAISFLTDLLRRSRTETAVRAMKGTLGQPGATARAAKIISDIAHRGVAPAPVEYSRPLV